ncbi:MAG: DUF5666 domain-containing protein [Anaerolineae bacterium]
MSNFPRRTRSSIAFTLLLIALLAIGLMPAAAQADPTSTPFPPTMIPPAGNPTLIPPLANATATPFSPTMVPPMGSIAPRIEMVGFVSGIGLGIITVNGQAIDTSNAEMNAMPIIGAPVKIEGYVNAEGQIVATEVKTVNLALRGLQPGEIELVGPLTGMTGPRLTIAGIPMDATTAEFGLGVGLGQLVKVHASLNDQGAWVIREVELASADDAANFTDNSSGEFEITGTLDSVDGTTIVVNGRTIDISGAEVSGLLVPGALVKVHLSLVGDQWVAREVELADRSAAGDFEDENDDHGGSSGSGHSGSDDGSSHDINDDHSSDSGSNSGSSSDDSASHDENDDHSGSSGSSGSEDHSGDDHSGHGSDDSGSDDHGSGDD